MKELDKILKCKEAFLETKINIYYGVTHHYVWMWKLDN